MDSDTDFINFERKQLEDLQKTFTPAQQKQYGEEVEYINYLLTLLEKQQKQPQTKKQKEKEEKTKKQIAKSLSQLVNNYTVSKATKITHTELTPEEMLDAKLTRASNKYYRLGGVDSENYLAQEGVKDWKIDEELSNDKGIVAYNEKTGKAKLAFRGTDRGNLGDLEADARIYLGTETNHAHFKEAREQTRAMIEKYGKENSSVSGYSLGGNKSWLMGNEFGIDSTGFNSFIGKNIVNRPDINVSGAKHKIIRTQDDLPSIQASYMEGKNNTEVKVVETRGGNMRALNPYKAHEDKNFISNEGRSGNKNNQGALDIKAQELAEHATKHGELRTLDEMIKLNKRIKVKGDLTQGLPDRMLTEEEFEARSNRIGGKLNEISRINKLTQGDRMEAKIKARQDRGIDYETRGSDFDGGLELDTPLINRNDPRYKGRQRPTYQTELERNTLSLPDLHIPKKPVSKKQKAELGDNLPSHNEAGEYIEMDDLALARQTAQLERQAGIDTARSMGGYKFTPQRDTLGDEIRGLERKMDIRRPFKPVPTSTTPDLDIELEDTLEFARGLSPPRSRGRTKTLDTKTRAEIKGLRNKTNPKLERPNSKSRALQQQTERLEDSIRIEQPITTDQPTEQTFTEWSNENNVKPTNHKKTLWELSGGKLTDAEKEGYTKENFNDIDELNDFVEMDSQERQQQLNEHSATQAKMETELNSFDNAGIRASGNSYGMEIARGLHPSNLLIGYLSGKGADYVMDKYVDAVIPDQPEPLKTAETGAIAGGITSTILGTAFLPEAVAGASGYLTQKYATEGIYKGLKSVGVDENTSTAVAETGGGAAAGGVAGALGAFTAGALAGGEEGTLAGLGFGSLELGAIGAGIGGLIGLGGYAWGRLHG